jgi:hypothetical protein
MGGKPMSGEGHTLGMAHCVSGGSGHSRKGDLTAPTHVHIAPRRFSVGSSEGFAPTVKGGPDFTQRRSKGDL